MYANTKQKRQKSAPLLPIKLYFVLCLSFTERTAGGLTAVAGATALDVLMLRHALVILVMDTVRRLTVNADNTARVL